MDKCGSVLLVSVFLLGIQSDLFAQQWTRQLPTANAESLGFSDYGSSPFINGIRTWEQVIYADDVVIRGVTWWSASGFENPETGLVTPVDSDANDWLFEIRDVDTNGAEFFYQKILKPTQVFQGDKLYSGQGTVRAYVNHAFLDDEVVLEDETRYWVSLLARSDTFSPFNAWWSSEFGDGISYMQSFSETDGFGVFEDIAQDRAFRLYEGHATSFSDSEFSEGWIQSDFIVVDSPIAPGQGPLTSTVESSNPTENGNPGAHRRHDFDLTGGDWVYVVNLNEGFTVDPSTTPISSINYSLDAIAEREGGNGNNIFMLVVEQDGETFFSVGRITSATLNDPWISTGRTAATESDFDTNPNGWILPRDNVTPDFSTAGGMITIGYATLAGVNTDEPDQFFTFNAVDNLVVDIFGQPTLLTGDVNGDGTVDLLDVDPFVTLLVSGLYSSVADINGDGAVDLTDVQPFVEILL